jgi:cysteine desulfurase
METYLDHAAATYVDERVKKEMDKYCLKEYGNPGSFNTVGLRAKEAVDKAREKVAGIIGAEPKEIIFTGSGTESINLAIKGVARALKKSGKGKHIITSTIEHHAVLDTCKYLEEEEGFEVTYVGVDRQGLVNPNDVESAIKEDTILISIMYANNEIGTIEPIEEIGAIARKRNVIFHTDACQAGMLDLDVRKLNADLMTLNGSKIYGPKGTGMLYVKKGTPIKPIIHGGGQEFGLRSGTENVPGIVGFAKALEIAQHERKREAKRLTKLRDALIKGLMKIPKVMLNGHPTKRLPNNVNVSILDIEGESLLLNLNEHGICASSGSACTSKSLKPSHVILALGVPAEIAHGSLRFTLGKRTTRRDIDKVVKVLPRIVERLRELSPVTIELEEKGEFKVRI